MQPSYDSSTAILGLRDPSHQILDKVTQMVAEGLVSGQTDDVILRRVIGSHPKVPMVAANLRQFVEQSRTIAGIGEPVPTSTWRGPFVPQTNVWGAAPSFPAAAERADSHSDSVFDDDDEYDELRDEIFSASPEELAILASKSSVNHVAHLKSTSTQDLEVHLPEPQDDVSKETSISRLLARIAWTYAKRGYTRVESGVRHLLRGQNGNSQRPS